MTEANRTEEHRVRLDDPVNAVIEKTETFEASDGVRVVTYHYRPGLTKREMFAAMAMQGAVANNGVNASFEGIAREAVKYADALLKELSQ